ncbi:hypothetical protein F4818DRAFT_406100 [Hypoxylon cercidicola]|nr:hypothetical protein F4818DRAFT_406100 [Hypoxylon cercidicola]
MIQHSSSCSLTRRSDKPVAISGQVSRFQTTPKGEDNNVAGLWKSQLWCQLLWSAHGGYPLYDTPPLIWSWASINGSVNWNSVRPADCSSSTMIDILEAHGGHPITGQSSKGVSIETTTSLFRDNHRQASHLHFNKRLSVCAYTPRRYTHEYYAAY